MVTQNVLCLEFLDAIILLKKNVCEFRGCAYCRSFSTLYQWYQFSETACTI